VRISRVLLGASLAAVLAVPVATVPALAQTSAASGVRYVALGDSYSSGDGAGSYGTSGSCDRSANAYPQQWADANDPASFSFVACAGATTSDVVNSQVSSLSASTTLVSITIGGNDAGFSTVMATCVLAPTSTCEDAVGGAEALVADLLPTELNTVLQTIRHDAPAARIVVLDYPDLYDLSRSSGCIGLSTADRTALNQGADQLDSAISAAAARNGDTFTDVRSQFGGHEICDGSASWLNSVTWPIGSSYHPTASGQELGYLPAFTSAAG
jgi:lysophospholipase L1-like esterase